MQITSNTTASERCREPKRKMKQEEKIRKVKSKFHLNYFHSYVWLLWEQKGKSYRHSSLQFYHIFLVSGLHVTSFPGRALHFSNLCDMPKSCSQPCFIDTLPYQPSYFEGLASQMLTFQILLKRCGKKSYADTHSHLSQISSSIDRELQL